MESEPKELQLNLNLEEVNLILAALSERPFREVFELIGKIHEQGSEQLGNDEDGLPPFQAKRP